MGPVVCPILLSSLSTHLHFPFISKLSLKPSLPLPSSTPSNLCLTFQYTFPDAIDARLLLHCTKLALANPLSFSDAQFLTADETRHTAQVPDN